MSNFKKGDRVKVLPSYFCLAGEVGTVLSTEEMFGGIPVKFDNKSSGLHDCRGLCEDEEGYCIPESCLENLSRRFKVGDIVRFTNAEAHEEYPQFYPKVGIFGKVYNVDDGLLVQWEQGSTSGKDRYWCDYSSVEKGNPDTEKGESMVNFKIGDRVEVIKPFCNAKVGDIGTIKGFHGKSCIAVEFDRESKSFHDCNDLTKPKHGHYMWEEHIKLCESNYEKIEITHEGKTTFATMYKDGKKVKTAEAKCHPDDDFDFGIGAKLAVERLFAHEPEYFTGDVVCVEAHKAHGLRVGMIYHVEDGNFKTDIEVPYFHTSRPAKDFKEFTERAKIMGDKFVELVK